METKLYEICFWVKDLGKDEALEAEQEKIKQAVSAAGGVISFLKALEKRPLAYPIKKQKIGWWGKIVFGIAPEKLTGIRKALLYEQAILRKTIFELKPEKQKKKIFKKPVFQEMPIPKPEAVLDKVLDTKLKEILEYESQ
jgi:ribosomal protein S6